MAHMSSGVSSLILKHRGNKVDCMTDIGWGEFDRITTRGLKEVREMLRMNF